MLFIGLACSSKAQISIAFNPALFGQSIDGLSFAQIVSPAQTEVQVALAIRVSEIGGTEVVRINTAPFWLYPGSLKIDRNAFVNARFSFANTALGNAVRQSGKFAEAEYEYCYEIEVLKAKGTVAVTNYEQCFVYKLQPLTPLLLINPLDGDEFCNKRPSFTWQPPMPLPPNAKFRLLLAELKEGQDPVEAVSLNQPLIHQANIRINSLTYLVNIPDLKEGHRYVWQVTVYLDQTILKKSEVWTFAIKCKDEQKPLADSYRNLTGEQDGSYYVANRYLRFALTNPYVETPLSYSIQCLTDPSLSVKGLPKLTLAPGFNKYDVDLGENSAMKAGYEYVLKVYLSNNKQLLLRFRYEHE